MPSYLSSPTGFQSGYGVALALVLALALGLKRDCRAWPRSPPLAKAAVGVAEGVAVEYVDPPMQPGRSGGSR